MRRAKQIGILLLLVALAVISMIGPFRRPSGQGRRRPTPLAPATATTSAPRTLIQHETESFIEQQAGDLASRTGLTFHDATCVEPGSVTAGTTYDCTAIGPDGLTYSFYGEITDSEHFVLHSGRTPASATSLSG